MYEVGGWFVHLMNIGILALIATGAMIAILYKRGQYQKQAQVCIRAEIQLPTGWNEYHTVECDFNAKSLDIENFTYLLNSAHRRWDKHPRNPILGLTWLQVPIRIESWEKDNPEPIRPTYEKIIATAAEIKAISREVQAANSAMEIQEIDNRQKELINAITNQPNKMIVYVMLGAAVLISGISAFMLFQGLYL